MASSMSEFGQKIIFTELLDRHSCIQVPKIQRDYAQGRQSEKEVLEAFLDVLQRALSHTPDAPTLPLNLDFIYGSVEESETNRFLPLDGQQRLTTLFLLHWYLAWQDDSFQEFHKVMVQNGKSCFSYAVRQSAVEFYDKLVQFQPDGSPDSFKRISSLITDQSWYYSYWRLDPTIQSSLNVLDAIHERFRSSDGLYARLTDTKQPAITFQLLNLDSFALSDDLYIKMNARGKPLTRFEMFKARYEQVLSEQFEEKTTSLDGRSVSIAEFFSQRIDTTWADFFWGYRNTDTNVFDEAVINFFRLVALLSRDPENHNYQKDISTLRDKRVKPSFSLFRNEGWLDENFYNLLVELLEAWSSDETNFRTHLPNTRYFDEESLFKKAIKEPTNLSSSELVQLAGYAIFVNYHKGSLKPAGFQEWMRVVYNLSINTSYDRTEDLQRCILALTKTKSYSEEVLQFLAETEKPMGGFNRQQVSEEKLKAELIITDPRWRPLIDRAEGHGYFRGQVEFLLDFCGALKKSRELICGKWDQNTHNQLQDEFEHYLSKAEKMFTPRGLKNIKDYRWERALLSIGDYLLPSGAQNISFLTNSVTGHASWKRLLRGGDARRKFPEARNILKRLLDCITTSNLLSEQLDKIIESAAALPEWRQALIETPKAIKYCERRVIRRSASNHIYLLKRTQRNGTHAELYTYCLYLNTLLPMHAESELAPLNLENYYDVIGVSIEPHVRLTWSYSHQTIYFHVEWDGLSFITYVHTAEINELSDLKSTLHGIDFFENEDRKKFERKCNSTEILGVIVDIRHALSELS